MKRFALVILALVACTGGPVNPPVPEINTATLKRSAPCALNPDFIPESYSTGIHRGSRWVWDLAITFYTTPCVSDVNAKVWFVYPDGRKKPVGSYDAPAVGMVDVAVVREFSFRWLAPKEWGTFPEPWHPHFVVDVRAGGAPIGSFDVYDH